MKSKILKRSIAIMLCMVIVLSGSGYLLAETFEEGNAEVMEASVTDEPAEDATVQEETAEAGNDATVEVEIPAQQEEPSTPAAETPAAEAPAAEVPAAETPEGAVLSAAAELKQEFKDKDNVVVQSVTAKLPEGAFQADISEVTMEVKHLKEDKDTYINDMIKEILPEYTYADNIVLFDIQFKVNGTITDPLKPVEITIEDKDINIEDKDKEKVFYFDPADPAVAGDKDELEGLTVKDCKTDKVTAEVSKSTIYGCYEWSIADTLVMGRQDEGS